MIRESLLERRLREGQVHNPRSSNVILQVQRTFYFGFVDVNRVIRDFYEGLAQAIFSGDLRDRQREGECDIEPDVTSMARKRYIEVKAAGHTRRIMLKDEQIEKYTSLQISEDPIPDPRIYFTLFRYGTRGIQKALREKSEEEAIEYLAQDTRFMVGLPLSIIHTIHRAGFDEISPITRYDGERGVSCTNFSTLLFDSFFSRPEQTIRDFSLYPGDYDIKRRQLGELIVNQHLVKPFPLVLIKDTDAHHAKWISQLRQELLGGVPF
ncbi:MAG: hypothetical protein ABIH92_05625 [Nanoarchaeota archaeon]